MLQASEDSTAVSEVFRSGPLLNRRPGIDPGFRVLPIFGVRAADRPPTGLTRLPWRFLLPL